MTVRRRFWLAVGLVALTAGCRGGQKSDLIEAELRVKDRELRQLRGELDRSSAINQAYENTLRGPPAHGCNSSGSTACATIKEVVLGRGTGAMDEDKIPGAEGLMVVLVPRDSEGSAIKAPGTVVITLMQFSSEGLKSPLSTWQIPAAELRSKWKDGLFSTGYFVPLTWKITPVSEKLRIVAQFTAADGVVFEDEKDVFVRLLAEPQREKFLPPACPPGPLLGIPHVTNKPPAELLPPKQSN